MSFRLRGGQPFQKRKPQSSGKSCGKSIKVAHVRITEAGRRAHRGRGHAGSLGQSIIIENVGGANGSIGTGRVARTAPDGYTLVLGIWNTHVGNAVTNALQYDVVNDFAPIALLADAPLLLVPQKAIPANDL